VGLDMCRLLAFRAPTPRSLRDAVQEPTFSAFRELSRIHGDGWGVAWIESHGQIAARRSTLPAIDDPLFLDAADEVSTGAGLAHLRWASEGLAIAPANTHPFIADGWAFAHNGFVRGSSAIEQLLSDRHRRALVGATDSERYFRLVLQCAEQSGDMVSGVQAAATRINELSGAVSINAMLLSAARLLAVQGLVGATPPLDDLLAMVEDPAQLPVDHLDSYFRLCYCTIDASLVIASSGVPDHRWTELPANSVMDVDVASGDWQLHPLLSQLQSLGSS
jgi:predicted glutamine amidotransferase